MAGSKKSNTSSWITLGIAGVTAGICCGMFASSYLTLRDNDQIRALWYFGFALLWMIVTTILVAIALTNWNAPYLGNSVSPYGEPKYSPPPKKGYVHIPAASEAQDAGEVVFRGGQANVEEPTGSIRPFDGGTGR